jgi:hypothetical protein
MLTRWRTKGKAVGNAFISTLLLRSRVVKNWPKNGNQRGGGWNVKKNTVAERPESSSAAEWNRMTSEILKLSRNYQKVQKATQKTVATKTDK